MTTPKVLGPDPLCQVCGGPLERHGGTYRNAGRWPKWCSADCRRQGRTLANRARYGAAPIPTSTSCGQCGRPFPPKRAVQVYCSPLCRDRHNRAATAARRPLRVRASEALARGLRRLAIAIRQEVRA